MKVYKMNKFKIRNIIKEEIENTINEIINESNIISNLINSNTNGILKSILIVLEPFLNTLLDKFKDSYIKTYKREPSIYDIQDFIIQQLYKVINSIETYLLNDDILINIESNYTNNGIIINAIIERNNIKYTFQTDVILAGGYNIQILHNRYIVKTKLPNNKNNNVISNIFKTKIKNLQGAKKIEDEINDYNKLIDKLEYENKINNKLNDDDIIDIIEKKSKLKGDTVYFNLTWNDIIDRNLTDRFVEMWNNDTQNKYSSAQDYYNNVYIPNMIKMSIENWKRVNIHDPKYIKELKMKVEKLKNKLNKL